MPTDFQKFCSDRFTSKSETYIEINDKSQGSVVAHLRCGGLFSYQFAMYLLLSLVVKKRLQAKRLIVSCALSALQCIVLTKDKELTDQITYPTVWPKWHNFLCLITL